MRATTSKAAGELEHRVQGVRAFNRFYTKVIGVLRESLLDSPYTLTEARVLFELAQRDANEVVALRRTLDLDGGYLSRILVKFESDGLVTRERSTSDGRRQVARLTDRGWEAFAMVDTRSAQKVRALLSPLSEGDQGRLVGAMRRIQEVLEDPRPESDAAGSRDARAFILREPRPGDFGWVVHRHGVLYNEAYGWDERFEALVARIVADYVGQRDPERERAWIADVAGEPVGCIFCVRKDDTVARLRLLLVEPSARGLGVGTRLVEECTSFARRAGYEEMILWTQNVLTQARRIYERAGFALIEEERHARFGPDLLGQTWGRKL